MVRPQADFDRSLEVLRLVKKNYPQMTVKSGIMAGLGERKEEVVETLKELCDAGVEVVTIGQYFAPSRTNLPVAEQVTDETFERYRKLGEAMGIKKIFSGRFVRSSYMAEDIIKGQRTALQPSGGSHG
jgi:lipoic acid synthetase